MLFPLGVALAGVVAFLTVDRNPAAGSPEARPTCWPLGSIVLVVLESTLDRTKLLLALAHWLVYLQLIKMFLPKTVEDDWLLFLLGLMQVLVGAVISQSDRVGDAAVRLGGPGALGPRAVLAPARRARRPGRGRSGRSDAATHPRRALSRACQRRRSSSRRSASRS